MLASLLSLIARGLNQMPACKNWLILLFQKIDNKNSCGAAWGGHYPHHPYGVGASAANLLISQDKRDCNAVGKMESKNAQSPSYQVYLGPQMEKILPEF